MRTRLIIFFFFISFFCKAQIKLEWQKNFGGSDHDFAYNLVRAANGDMIFFSDSYSSDSVYSDTAKHKARNSGSSCWLFRCDGEGKVKWRKLISDQPEEYALDIAETADGGFIGSVKIKTQHDGMVANLHTSSQENTDDAWLIKFDSTGNIEWQKAFGGSNHDAFIKIIPHKKGYFLGGCTFSIDGDVSGNHGEKDIWIAEIDLKGNMLWQKCFGGSDYDELADMMLTSDNHLLVSGNTGSRDGDVKKHFGSKYDGMDDCWIIKLDLKGNIIWQETFGGRWDDQDARICESTDHHYFIACNSNSDDSGGENFHAVPGVPASAVDILLIKLSADGKKIWQKNYGGTDSEIADAIIPGEKGGCIIAGGSTSRDGDLKENKGFFDTWILDINASGKIINQFVAGGDANEDVAALKKISSDEILVMAFTSSKDGDIKENHGKTDIWFTRFKLKN